MARQTPTARRLAILVSNLDGPRPITSPPHPAAPTAVAASAAEGGRGWTLSDEELYMFDTMGFLRVRNMLDKETLALALDAVRGVRVRSRTHRAAAALHACSARVPPPQQREG
eukprot:COSAG04_NODE_1634_length_6102_cov_20.966184_6_plen_112_part_01